MRRRSRASGQRPKQTNIHTNTDVITNIRIPPMRGGLRGLDRRVQYPAKRRIFIRRYNRKSRNSRNDILSIDENQGQLYPAGVCLLDLHTPYRHRKTLEGVKTDPRSEVQSH